MGALGRKIHLSSAGLYGLSGDAPDSAVKPSKQNLSLLVSFAAPSVTELVTHVPFCISIDKAAQSSTSISFTLVVNFANTLDTGPKIMLAKS